MKETVALTGVSGHLGSNLVRFLLQEGFQVRALIRSGQGSFLDKNLTWIQGDLNSKDNLIKLLESCDILIHCASRISLNDKDKELVYNTNVSGTKNLIELCLKHRVRMIYISSSSVGLSTGRNEKFDETNPYVDDHKFYYAWTKAMSEKEVLASVRDKNLDALIIRPTAIVGPADPKPSQFGQTIFDIYKGKLSILSGGGYDLVDVRDLCQTIINSLYMGKKGQVYLVGGSFISLKKLAKLLNPKGFHLIIPANLLIILLPIISLYDRLFGLKWPVTKESLYTLKNAPSFVDSSKARREIGHSNRAIHVTLDDLIQWFNQNNLQL